MPININGNGAITGVASLGAPTEINSGADNLVLEADPNAAHADTTIGLEIDGARVVTIDNNGRILNGATASISLGNVQGNYQFQGPNGERGSFTGITYRNDNLGPILCLAKSRGTGIDDFTAVESGDQLGDIRWTGAGGSDADGLSARIHTEATSTFTDTSKPGALVFSTASDGSETVTERMRIDQDGRIILATTANCPGIAWDDNDTSGANVDSRTLGDYEEGTWAPVNGNGTGTFDPTSWGRYTRIGHRVWLSGYVLIDTMDNTTSVFEIDGIPFAPIDPGAGGFAGTVMGKFLTFATSTATQLVLYVTDTASGIRFYGMQNNTNWETVENVDVNADDAFYFSVSYEVA